jgi:hypothetical protein
MMTPVLQDVFDSGPLWGGEFIRRTAFSGRRCYKTTAISTP